MVSTQARPISGQSRSAVSRPTIIASSRRAVARSGASEARKASSPRLRAARPHQISIARDEPAGPAEPRRATATSPQAAAADGPTTTRASTHPRQPLGHADPAAPPTSQREPRSPSVIRQADGRTGMRPALRVAERGVEGRPERDRPGGPFRGASCPPRGGGPTSLADGTQVDVRPEQAGQRGVTAGEHVAVGLPPRAVERLEAPAGPEPVDEGGGERQAVEEPMHVGPEDPAVGRRGPVVDPAAVALAGSGRQGEPPGPRTVWPMWIS